MKVTLCMMSVKNDLEDNLWIGSVSVICLNDAEHKPVEELVRNVPSSQVVKSILRGTCN